MVTKYAYKIILPLKNATVTLFTQCRCSKVWLALIILLKVQLVHIRPRLKIKMLNPLSNRNKLLIGGSTD